MSHRLGISKNFTAHQKKTASQYRSLKQAVAYAGILFGVGGSTNSVEDIEQRERGSGAGSPLVRGSGGSCNLVEDVSFRIVKFSYFLVL